jgi:glycosyltransferase involved in cell wall biosynthesis
MGLPVVATRVGGTPEAVLHERTGLLAEPTDVDGLTGALVRLLGDAEFRQRLGAAAQDHVRGHFSLDATVDGALELYARLFSPAEARIRKAG